MEENYFTQARVWAAVAWAVVGLFLVAAWSVMLFDPQDWGIAVMLAASACAGSAVAATLHMRAYIVRVCSLVRVTAGLQSPTGGGGLRSVG